MTGKSLLLEKALTKLFYRISSPLQWEAQISNSGGERQRQKRSHGSIPWITGGHHCPAPHSNFPKDQTFQKIQKSKAQTCWPSYIPFLMLLLKLPKILPIYPPKFLLGVAQVPGDHLAITPSFLPMVWPKLPSKRHGHREMHQPSPPPAFAQGFRPSHYSQGLAAENQSSRGTFSVLQNDCLVWCPSCFTQPVQAEKDICLLCSLENIPQIKLSS